MKRKYLIFIYSVFLILLYSFPSNAQWYQTYSGGVVNSVYFLNQNYGMACGNNGLLLKTIDGGLNWTSLVSNTLVNLNDILLFSNNIAVAVGDSQLIIRSTNAGNSWTPVVASGGFNYRIRNLQGFDSSYAIAHSSDYFGSYYIYLYKTSNKGATWSITQPPTAIDLPWIHFINPTTGWSYGSYYMGPPYYTYFFRVGKTINGGTNWQIISQSQMVSMNPGKVYFVDTNLGFKYNWIGNNCYLARSVNGGTNWTTIQYGIPQVISSFYFINTQSGWAVGGNGMILRTTNSFTSYEVQQSPVISDLQKIFFINENTGWIAAGTGGILKTTNGGITGLSSLSQTLLPVYNLKQNYPNPFNPVTDIEFDIPKRSYVKLVIYDITGREVKTITNEELSAGSYRVRFDGSGLSSGLYFYRIVAGEYKKTNKMVLIK